MAWLGKIGPYKTRPQSFFGHPQHPLALYSLVEGRCCQLLPILYPRRPLRLPACAACSCTRSAPRCRLPPSRRCTRSTSSRSSRRRAARGSARPATTVIMGLPKKGGITCVPRAASGSTRGACSATAVRTTTLLLCAFGAQCCESVSVHGEGCVGE